MNDYLNDNSKPNSNELAQVDRTADVTPGALVLVTGASGYVGGGSTHAWVRAYLPSAGWVEFDPTNGIVGNRDLIRVAVARDPHQAIPLHGTYAAPADAFLGMDVTIRVVSAGEDAKVQAAC